MLAIILAIIVVVCTILYFIKKKGPSSDLFGTWVGEAKPGETRVRRDLDCLDHLIDAPHQGYKTLYELLESFPTKGKKELIGYREVLEKKVVKTVTTIVDGKEEKKDMYKYKMSDYKYLSDKEYYEYCHKLANGLAKYGFQKGDRIGFYCETRYEWMAMVFACVCRGIEIVTVYATLGKDAVEIALEETNCKAILVSEETAGKLEQYKLYQEKKLQVLTCDKLEDIPDAIYIGSEEFINAPRVDDVIPNENDTALIMYTSGTAKEPKGVIVQHHNILPISWSYCVKRGYGAQTRYICYLPLAHIFEFAIEMCNLVYGGTLGYSSPKTLISAFIYDCECDLQAFKPSFMNGVPTIFNKIRKVINDKLENASSLERNLFDICYNLKYKLYIEEKLQPRLLFVPLIKLIDLVLFKKLKNQIFGDNLTSVLMGGSPLSKDLQMWLQVVMGGVDILQGYGMTEACGPVSTMANGDYEYGTIGEIYPNFEAKLVDVEEMGYLTSDSEPKGELLLKGPSMTTGYFNRPEENKSAFTEDGWFRTGDITMISKEGRFYIIDRKKNLIKQPCGEYISLEKIEMIYSSSKFVENICVIADQYYDYTVGLIVVNKGEEQKYAQEKGIDVNDVIKEKEFYDRVKQDFKQYEKTLNSHEKFHTFTLLDDEWSAENGLLTAALKLRRKQLTAKYDAEIKEMFSN